MDVHMYRLMIGSLMYLTSSRPDIMFAVCACVRYQANLKVSHLHAMKRIFRLISWQYKKQKVVVNSTTEAEYVAASSCCGHIDDGKAVWNGIGVNTGDSKLMLLGITYYCWFKVNATRHNLLLLGYYCWVKVNAVEGILHKYFD
ncbi:hypothetical protein Tco_0183656 [Tanacetum coccineum]